MNNQQDRFSKMVAAGQITRAEAKRRRAQRDLDRRREGAVLSLPSNDGRLQRGADRIRQQSQVTRAVPATGYRQDVVWTTLGEWPAVTPHANGTIEFRKSQQVVPADATTPNFAQIAALDHKLVEIRIEVTPGLYDPGLLQCIISAALYRGDTSPETGQIRQYAGAQTLSLASGGPMFVWTFKPRVGDRVDSLDGASPTLNVVLGSQYVLLRPPTGERLGQVPVGTFAYKVGLVYMVRERSGLLF
jgi:hypothetical protein